MDAELKFWWKKIGEEERRHFIRGGKQVERWLRVEHYLCEECSV